MFKNFSAYYKKMCDSATEIQDFWKEEIDTIADIYVCCYKDEHKYGNAREEQVKGMIPEEKESLRANNVWLPLNYQIEKRMFGMKGNLDRINVYREYGYYKADYYGNKERIKEMEEHLRKEEIVHVLALMFVMGRYYFKQWDFKNQTWVPIKT